MTKRERENYTWMTNALSQMGFTFDESESLRRISMTLHRWSEHECNGAIQRDGENGDGAPFWFNTNTGRKIGRVADREKGALRRLEAIMAKHPTLRSYVQGDPRGCALYILRPADIIEGHDISSYYSRGIGIA